VEVLYRQLCGSTYNVLQGCVNGGGVYGLLQGGCVSSSLAVIDLLDMGIVFSWKGAARSIN
jgi:hypothetical protein